MINELSTYNIINIGINSLTTTAYIVIGLLKNINNLVNGFTYDILGCIAKNNIKSIVDYLISLTKNDSSAAESQPNKSDSAIPLINEIKDDIKAIKNDFNSLKDNLKNENNSNITDSNSDYLTRIFIFVLIVIVIIIFLTVILTLLFKNKKINRSKRTKVIKDLKEN